MKKHSNDRIKMVINFKRLNAITIKDVFPVLDVDEILKTVNGSKTDFLKPDPEKCKVVLEYPMPKTKKQSRSFLGLANFYRKYIEAFADISKALTDLTKKALPDRIKWSLNADIAFNTLKRKLSKEPVLMAPNFHKSFVLQTDASLYGISGILCQEDDTKQLHPISYASRILSQAETRYSIIERELLAIVWSLGQYAHIMFGQEVKTQTDHQPLRYLES